MGAQSYPDPCWQDANLNPAGVVFPVNDAFVEDDHQQLLDRVDPSPVSVALVAVLRINTHELLPSRCPSFHQHLAVLQFPS